MGEYGQPADIANLVCFLASPLARYITGTVIPVDGGWSASAGYAQNPQPWDDWSELGQPIRPGTAESDPAVAE